jgi:hypothetical protein
MANTTDHSILFKSISLAFIVKLICPVFVTYFLNKMSVLYLCLNNM